MSRSALTGNFGLARQSAKDTPASSLTYFPVTSVGVNPNQNAATLPAEIGGSYYPRGSYKASVNGGGDIAAVVRPNSFGQLLMAHVGQDTVTPVPSQTGAYSHALTPFAPGAGIDLPWFTLLKNVSDLVAEQYLNAKSSSLRLDLPKIGIATCQAGWFATTPSTVAIPTGIVIDSTPQFQTAVGSVSLIQEGGSGNISANSAKVERFSFNFTNTLSQDEYSVGNFYPDDITLLQRTTTADLDFTVRDSALYSAVYHNGASLPAVWSPTLYRGNLTVTLTSTALIPGTTQPYQLIINFPGLDFLMMPLPMQGADLVRATLSTQVTLGPSGGDTVNFTLINGVASY